jgi:GT2 family glycosyltransferase
MAETAVVILNWNGKHFLEQYLPFLTQFTPVAEADIVIADNASTDGSMDYLQEAWPGLQRIQLEKNYGFADGYNRALKQLTSYSYFVLLNSDIEVTEGWLPALIAPVKKSTKIGACMPKIRSLHQREKFEYAGAAGGFIDHYGYPFCRGRIFDTLETDNGQYDDPCEIFWATGACMAVRAEAFFKNGGFDPDFFAHQEEIDLCWRLQNAGYKIMYAPESAIYHVGGGTLPKENPHKTFLNFRNNLLLLYKNLPRDSVFRILFFRMSLDFISALRFALRGDFPNATAVWKAHQAFYAQVRKYRASGAEMPRPADNMKLTGMYRGSIVWDFFVCRKKIFTDIPFN